MRNSFVRAALGVACAVVLCTPGFALDAMKVAPVNRPALSALRATARISAALPREVVANPDRAYPPSCLQSPIALGLYSNDPNAVQTTITLSGDAYGSAAEQSYLETDTLTVFRVPCSGGTSAVLIEIDRPSNADHNTTSYPVMPLLGIYASSSDIEPLRAPQDPNTFYSDTVAGTPLFDSTVFVIENFYNSATQFDFNPAISVYVDNLLRNSNADQLQLNIPAYNPAKYAAASQPLPISGYESGNWYDPAHSGEGIQVEVGELTYPSRFISIAWYTYDEMGIPYWLFGSSGFTVGDRNVIVTLGYSSGGGFAGNFGAAATTTAWGTFNVSFPNCNTMNFLYTSGSNVPSSVPQGTGSKSWTRASQLNGLTCQ